MKKTTTLLAAISALMLSPAQADPTPTPMIVYKVSGGYMTQAEAQKMQLFIRQIQDSIVAGDPSPLPSINFNLIGERLAKNTISDLLRSGAFIEKRSTCSLIKDAFVDRYGALLKPEDRAEAAIACGCDMMDIGYGIIEAQLAANDVFHRGAECAGL
ncbi:hypothetical protein [Marinicella meishanensis]|uniref:hypothetical protein n=1 Tax=Marinicella meishanensis TaxID=2873263 RepID=UPI001CC19711|nr:hypothetical protein [Marinicella sp. NBU2979]